MTVGQWLADSQSQLESAGIESARLDTLLLLAYVFSKDKNWLLAHSEDEIPNDQLDTANKLLKRRVKREPLAYLVGHKEFYGHSFKVNEHVLIPRPETEALVEFVAQNAAQESTVLDVGTGSGCIAASLKIARPDLVITASDVSRDALNVAAENSRNLGADIEFFESDLFKGINQKFDVICANLPYVDQDQQLEKELDFEPSLALYADNHGLRVIEEFFKQAPSHLNVGGMIVIEHEPNQQDSIRQLTNMDFKEISDFVSLFT